jgi:hypothetical protein
MKFMQEAEIKFEREDLEGLVAVGTYLAGAARQMGIDLGGEEFGEAEFSVVKISRGNELLSAPTKTEIENLSAERRAGGERFAEQTKIERAGEITIMTTKKKEETKPEYEAKREAYRKEFEELPLEKKVASLVELESIALSETLSFVINSPYKIVGAIMDVLAEFGLKMEADAKKQTRPAEHQSADDENQPSVSEENKSKKTTRGKKTAPPPSV